MSEDDWKGEHIIRNVPLARNGQRPLVHRQEAARKLHARIKECATPSCMAILPLDVPFRFCKACVREARRKLARENRL